MGLKARVARVLACAFAAMTLAGPAQAQITTTYTYDWAGRLVRTVDSHGPTVAYAYDKAGNRIQVGNGVGAHEYRAGEACR